MNHNQAPTQEAFKNMEMVQFSDGRLALGYRTPGDVIAWDINQKYADPDSRLNTIFVKTQGGKRLAVGSGVVIELPELDREKGEFGQYGQPIKGARIESIASAGLPNIVIGQPWEGITPDDPVDMVMMDYKLASPGYQDSEQVAYPNFFDSAHAHIERFEAALTAQGK